MENHLGQALAESSFQILLEHIEPDDYCTEKEQAQLAENACELMVAAYNSDFPDIGVAIGLSQDYFDGLHAMASHYASNGRYEEAATLFKRLLQLKPTEVTYYKAVGACQLGLKNYEAAEAAYSSAYFFAPLDAEISYYIGQAQYFQKKFEDAFDNLRFARVQAEDHPQPGCQIVAWSTQLLQRLQSLVPPEQAAKMDVRPPKLAT